MSTRCSMLYFQISDEEKKYHTFHIYREAFSKDEYYIVDDANRTPIRLTARTVKEIVDKWNRCRKK